MRSLILAIVFMTAYGEYTNTSGCNRTALMNLLNNAKYSIQQWQSTNHAKDFHLFRVTESTEKIIDQYEVLVKDCSDEQKTKMLAPMLVGAGIVADEPAKTEILLKAVEDEEVLEQVVGLFCAVDCSYLLNFTKKIEDSSAKIHIYTVINNLLEKTDLNHTGIDTKLSFIKDIDTAIAEGRSKPVNHALRKLLLNAVKADLILQHDNID